MELNLLTLVGIAVATMLVGYVFGLYEGRGQGYKRRKKEEAAEEPSQQPPDQLSEPSPVRTSPAPVEVRPPPPAVPDKSLLQLHLDENQMPVLEMDGRRADVAALDPSQRKRLIDLMLVMRPWIEAGAPAKPAPQPQPATPAPAPVPIAPRREAVAVAPVTTRPAENGAPTSIVGQIDAILQARIAGTPLADRAVRLTESPEGGVVVWIGLQRYPGVWDVPDQEVKTALKAAIAEWEERFTPS